MLLLLFLDSPFEGLIFSFDDFLEALKDYAFYLLLYTFIRVFVKGLTIDMEHYDCIFTMLLFSEHLFTEFHDITLHPLNALMEHFEILMA